MKHWRVGTFSMGLSLVLVGVTLLISTFKGLIAFDVLLSWWPVIFILLGLEILLYLLFSHKERPFIHYDVFSILFVGLLCCCCIAFALAASTGMLMEVRQALGSVERTSDLPTIRQEVPAAVQRIVVQANRLLPKIDPVADREVNLFGNYRTSTFGNENSVLQQDDVATIRTVGNTLYISIKELPQKSGFHRVYPNSVITLTLPQDIPVEIRGMNNETIRQK